MADLTVQRMLIKALLSSPAPMLRRMGGGGAVTLGGRTLDPRIQLLARLASQFPPIDSLGVEAARKSTADAAVLLGDRRGRGVRIENLSIEGPRGPIGLRAYRPAKQNPAAPLLVFAHGGGGVLGDLDIDDGLCRILARGARGAVFSIDYRLAPEHPFPAGLEDVLAAWRWARENTTRFGAPAGRLAIGGDSMGANLAAVVAQELKRQGEPQPVLQLLIYPAVDMVCDLPSMTTYADAYPLNRRAMDYFLRQYLAAGADPTDPRCSPGRSADLSGLAPALIDTAGFDPLVDQGEAYARKLTAAGVSTTHRRYDTLPHGFATFAGMVPAAAAACREIAALVRTAFEGPPSGGL